MRVMPPHMQMGVEAIQSLGAEAFSLLHKVGLGAADIASCFEPSCNPYKSRNALVKERSDPVPEDLSGVKHVQEGVQAEEGILQWASGVLGTEVSKPQDSWSFVELPFLTVNFDGLTQDSVPVEAKLSVGGKGYDTDKAALLGREWRYGGPDLLRDAPESAGAVKLFRQAAERCGMPTQYWVQLQVQMAAADAPYGYLAVWHKHLGKHALYQAMREVRFMDLAMPSIKETWEAVVAARPADWPWTSFEAVLAHLKAMEGEQ